MVCCGNLHKFQVQDYLLWLLIFNLFLFYVFMGISGYHYCIIINATAAEKYIQDIILVALVFGGLRELVKIPSFVFFFWLITSCVQHATFQENYILWETDLTVLCSKWCISDNYGVLRWKAFQIGLNWPTTLAFYSFTF